MDKPLKLNYKRTFIIGFAFFGILMLWQIYNTYCPPFLTELLESQFPNPNFTELDYQYIVGIIMACDNIFAMFMLPLFGHLSDKTHTKLGKRMPYIIVGTIASAIIFPFIAICFCYNSFVGLIISMGVTLIAMQMYRNPAVSLMPDLTPKPLRATANGIINFVGYIGAIIAGGIALFLPFQKMDPNEGANPYLSLIPFIIGSALLLITGIILFLTVKENKVLEEMKDDLRRGEELAEVEEKVDDDKPMGKANKIAFILLIASVFLWFMSFNSVETFWTNFGIYHLETTSYSLGPTLLAIASLVAFLPSGWLANKIGRKWTIVIGIILLVLCFTGGSISSFFDAGYGYDQTTGEAGSAMPIYYYIIFIVGGIGWAMINCCSYPMVVELCSKDKIGRFTGIYYAASMLAQSITPILVGGILTITNGWVALFPYAAAFMLLALVTFIFVKDMHKTKKSEVKKEEINSFE